MQEIIASLKCLAIGAPQAHRNRAGQRQVHPSAGGKGLACGAPPAKDRLIHLPGALCNWRGQVANR